MKLIEVLNEKPLKVLKNAVRDWGVPSSERKNRAKMTSALVKAIAEDGKMLTRVLLSFDKTTYRYFQETCESGPQRGGDDLGERFQAVESCPFLSIRRVGYDCEIRVPEEIVQLFNKVLSSAFVSQRCRQDYLVESMNAAVNLYGVISLREMAEVFNSYNKGFRDEDCRRTTENELWETCWARQAGWDTRFAEYSFVGFSLDRYLVNRLLCHVSYGSYHGDGAQIEEILDERCGEKRWDPGFERFMAAAHVRDVYALDRMAESWRRYGNPVKRAAGPDVSRRLTPASEASRELTLALMFLMRWRTKRKRGEEEPWSAWANYDREVLDELCDKDYIRGGRRMRHIILSKSGMAEARRIIEKYGIADWESLKDECDWPERYGD